MTPDRSVENHLREQAAGSNNQTQSAQAPTPNTINNNNPIPFQNSQKCVTNATGPTGQRGNKYSQPSNKGRVRRLPAILIHSLLFQIFSHDPVHTCRAGT